MDRYAALKRELRAFHSEDGHVCTNPERLARLERRKKQMESYAAGHPGADALALRREIYEFMREDFVPVLFSESPFYFENGGNGGWNRTGIGDWVLNHLSKKIFCEPNPEAANRFLNRMNQSYFAGWFFDASHHNPATSRLLQTGFKGIYEEALSTIPECQTEHEKVWLETAIAGLETIRAISNRYGEEARRRLAAAKTEEERHCMQLIANSAFTVPWEPPRTFYEALNLCLFVREIVAELDGLRLNSLGRPDAWLLGFYEADLAAGRLTRDDAYDLICRFLLMGDLVYNRNAEAGLVLEHENENTLTLGGCDEEGHEVFNDLTRLFLKAYRELDLIFPKPHCRFSSSSSSQYLRLIGDDILSGRGIYSLLNDDCIIPALTATGHSLADARNYCCTGCWDLVVASCEDNTGGNFFNLAKIVESTIHRSDEELAHVEFKPRRIDGACSFEDVYSAIMDNTRFMLRALLQDQHDYGCRQPEAAPAPMHSACSYDCLKNRKDFSEGGQRYNPHAVALSFFATYVDSLLAIQSLCFDRKICTLAELLSAVRNNWKGAGFLREQVLRSPHWGDDRKETTALARRIADDLLEAVADIPNEHGGRYQLAIWIYREFKRWGNRTLATPDGRYDGDELSQSLNPSHFRNREALTTVLRSLSCIDLTRFAGNSVINLCIERENFTSETVEALLRSFAALKLQLLQLNCMDSRDLEEARKHPEKYGHLIVRICGFSAKFVALSPEWQQEIISRRKY